MLQFNEIIFFEKPGCSTNSKQKKLLKSLGLSFLAMDLLSHKFTPSELLGFLQGHPVKQWFNPNAPKDKLERIDLTALSPKEALSLLLNDPILIKRPLLSVRGKKLLGFDLDAIGEVLGRTLEPPQEDLLSCAHA